MIHTLYVVGCGSIGRRHIRNFKAQGVTNIIGIDPSEFSRDLTRKDSGLEKFLNDVSEVPDARGTGQLTCAVIATPSSMHVPHGLALAKKGVHLFMEKPISDKIEGISELQKVVEENRLVAMMAMCYRFNSAFLQMKQLIDSGAIGKLYTLRATGGHYLPDWHPYADYRREYAAQKRLGGGVLLTSIHSINYIRFLAGELTELHSYCETLSNLEIDVEDIATLHGKTRDGAVVVLSLDFLDRSPSHDIRIVGSEGSIQWGRLDDTINLYEVKTKEWKKFPINTDVNHMYTAECRAFIDAVTQGKPSPIPLTEGIHDLELVLASFKSSQEKRVVKLPL